MSTLATRRQSPIPKKRWPRRRGRNGACNRALAISDKNQKVMRYLTRVCAEVDCLICYSLQFGGTSPTYVKTSVRRAPSRAGGRLALRWSHARVPFSTSRSPRSRASRLRNLDSHADSRRFKSRNRTCGERSVHCSPHGFVALGVDLNLKAAPHVFQSRLQYSEYCHFFLRRQLENFARRSCLKIGRSRSSCHSVAFGAAYPSRESSGEFA
jgi:hypothetical protein